MPTLNVRGWVTNLMKAWISQTCRSNTSVMKLISWLENRPKRMLQEVYVGRVLGGHQKLMP